MEKFKWYLYFWENKFRHRKVVLGAPQISQALTDLGLKPKIEELMYPYWDNVDPYVNWRESTLRQVTG